MISHLKHFLSYGGVNSSLNDVLSFSDETHIHTHTLPHKTDVVCGLQIGHECWRIFSWPCIVCVCMSVCADYKKSGDLWWNPTASLSVWLRIRRPFYEVSVFFCGFIHALVCSGGGSVLASFSCLLSGVKFRIESLAFQWFWKMWTGNGQSQQSPRSLV